MCLEASCTNDFLHDFLLIHLFVLYILSYAHINNVRVIAAMRMHRRGKSMLARC